MSNERKYEMEIHQGIGEQGLDGLFFADVICIDADGNRTSIGKTGQFSMKPRVEEAAREIVKAHGREPEIKPIELD
jgi:hypothetical protein